LHFQRGEIWRSDCDDLERTRGLAAGACFLEKRAAAPAGAAQARLIAHGVCSPVIQIAA
jgi:hypothetical protein